ncbi:hypothetical protein ABPG72_006727 [Tetrahymena utriculariae]
MSFNFFRELEILNEKKMIGPETFNEFASKQVEKFIKEPQNQHLSSLAFFQFCIHLNDKRFFLVVKPQFLQNTKAKEDYINAYKTYLKLKRDNCLVDIEEKYCSFKYNFFKLSQFDVPLNVYLQKQKINQVFLIRFALLLLKSIRKCHEKVYFIEHIKSSTVYIDTRKQNVLLINPIQKIILEQEKLINMKTSQVNQHKKIQTQTPKSTVLDLINKDSKDFIKTFLNVIGIDNLNFQEMHECNVLSSFFKRNFSGKITDSMQYLIIYFYILEQKQQNVDLLQIEFMLINILYQDIKLKQQKQLRQYLKNIQQMQNNVNSNYNKNKQNIISSKSTLNLEKNQLNQSKSLQNLNSSTLQNNLISKNCQICFSSNKQNQNSISKKCQTDKEDYSSNQHTQIQQNQNLTKLKLNNQKNSKQISKLTMNDQIPNNLIKTSISHEQKTSEQLRANDQQNNQQEQTYLDELQSNQSANNADSQIKLDQEQILSNTFYQSEFCNCLKDQTSWLNCIYKIEMTQDQAYFLWKKLDKVKEKSSQQWIMTAWIQFKYFKFFKEPLQIIHNQVLKLKNNNCPQKQKEQNQQQGTKSAEINSQSYCLIGIIYWKWKKYQKAVQAFNTALKIDKRNQYALYYLELEVPYQIIEFQQQRSFGLSCWQLQIHGRFRRNRNQFLQRFKQCEISQ